MIDLEVPNDDVTDWLAALKPYQSSTLERFLEGASLEEAAERWLASTGSPNIVPFGGTSDTKPFWERFREEFRKFVCDDASYEDDRAALSAEGPLAKAVLVSAVSAGIGATIGYAATLLAPAVTLLLCSVGRMGRNAYCQGVSVNGAVGEGEP